jgi:hypothetical protein
MSRTWRHGKDGAGVTSVPGRRFYYFFIWGATNSVRTERVGSAGRQPGHGLRGRAEGRERSAGLDPSVIPPLASRQRDVAILGSDHPLNMFSPPIGAARAPLLISSSRFVHHRACYPFPITAILESTRWMRRRLRNRLGGFQLTAAPLPISRRHGFARANRRLERFERTVRGYVPV